MYVGNTFIAVELELLDTWLSGYFFLLGIINTVHIL
jgi:hypothetical protein